MANARTGFFDKRSRYFRLPEQVAPDRFGRPQLGKSLRPLTTAAGRLWHVVEGGDRLDQLAYKYYRKSRHWWHVLDANPDIASPLDLLGETPLRWTELAVEITGPLPPWADVFRALTETPGVRGFETDGSLPEVVLADGPVLFTLPAAFAADLRTLVLVRSLAPTLDLALAAQGLSFDGALQASEEGPGSFLVDDLDGDRSFRIRQASAADPFEVAQLTRVYRWRVILHVNPLSVTDEHLRLLVEAHGFVVTEVLTRDRLGQSINIPARAP
jgi:hypothetical protein